MKPGSYSSSVRCGIGRPGTRTPPATQMVKLMAIQQPDDIVQTLRFNMTSILSIVDVL